MLVLGIDTSCDDTSLALVRDGREVLANVVSSQVPLHRLFGGVVPEIASRKHVEVIDSIFREALETARVDLDRVDAVGVTVGPGLIGSVLVGMCFAKGICLATGKPLVGVNHVEAHAMTILLEETVPFPFLALIVSGGHTLVVLFEEPCRFRVVGSTRDDAVGEAFDKIAKFLSLGYPGGRVIEELARRGDCHAVPFPRPMIDEPNYDFSFSGLKTSFVNYIKRESPGEDERPDLLASFQQAAFDVLVRKTVRAAKDLAVGRIVVGGGVASNLRLRRVMREAADSHGIRVFFPSPPLCTDNGAMVAVTAYYYGDRGLFSPLDVSAFSRMVRKS